MKLWLIIFSVVFVSVQLKAQYPMSAGNHNQTYYTCSGVFTDDGGTGGNYSPNITNRVITFCPGNPAQIIRFNFTQFHTEAWSTMFDVLSVYPGVGTTGLPMASYSGNLTPFIISGQGPGQCLTFRFNSDFSVQYAGWRANISCVNPCVQPVAVFSDGGEDDLVCFAEGANVVTMDASASYSSQPGFPITHYYWEWGDGTTSITTTPIANHTYPNNPGYYIVKMRVRTANTISNPQGCFSETIQKRIALIPPPTFANSSPTVVNVSCGESVSLSGVAASQTIVTMPPTGTGSAVALPDNINTPFVSNLDLTGYFPPGATLTSACFPRITLNLEHSFAGDLQIYLRAPSGQEIYLFNGYDDSNVGLQLFGYCVNAADNGVPGCVAPYHIVNSGGLIWGNAASRHNFSQPCAVWGGPCENQPYFRQNQKFNSSSSMNGLLGTPMNGVWTLRIVDRMTLDDGFLESWSISFPNSCYASQEAFTPLLSDGVWSHAGDGPAVSSNQDVIETPHPTTGLMPCPTGQVCIGNQLSNTQVVGPFTNAGSYTYVYTVTDELGCEYHREVVVNVPQGTSPTFAAFPTVYCQDEVAELPLPNNGVSGIWSPYSINTAVLGTQTYIFSAPCVPDYSVDITVNPPPILSPIIFNY